MAEDLSLDDIKPAVEVGVEYLILTLDYAMSLHFAYEGKPHDALVSLIQGPEQERSAAIDECLRTHREEVSVRGLRCTRCGKFGFELRECCCDTCGGQLEPEFVESEKELRGRAWERLIWSVPGTQARYIVPNWLVQELDPGNAASPAECELPKWVVFSRLEESVASVRREYIGKCWDHLHIKSCAVCCPRAGILRRGTATIL